MHTLCKTHTYACALTHTYIIHANKMRLVLPPLPFPFFLVHVIERLEITDLNRQYKRLSKGS